MPIHVFTSITCNYLPKARVLAESLKRLHPDYVFHLVLVDTPPSWFRVEDELFDSLIGLGDLGIKNPEQWVFQHSVVEACTGVKGFAAAKLLARRDCSAVFYFDPDIVILSRLDGLLAELETASVLVTPHITEPETTLDAILDNEFSVLRHGVYNLGFLGVGNTPEGRRFVDWWMHRLDHFCYDDIPRGIFTDQRWVDLAPAYFEGVRILRGPEYNVCTWNLTRREVRGSFAEGFTVNGRPMVFYHFSGLDSGAQAAMLNKYGSQMPALRELRDWYLAQCDLAGQRELGTLPWSFAIFDNGRLVTPLHRKRYREREDLRKAFPAPYFTGDVNPSYYHWFEANDESRVSPVRPTGAAAAVIPEPREAAPPATASAVPEYRVYLSVCGAGEEEAATAARDAAVRTSAAEPLHLAGPAELLERLLSDEELAARFRPLPLPDGASHEDAFEAALRDSAANTDVAFAVGGTRLCDGWDLRLAWTSRRTEGAATVSPINDGSACTYLGLAGRDLQELDAACYRNSVFSNPEIPRFLKTCVYVNREAVRETGGGKPQEFLSRTVRLRWPHVLADHVYTGTGTPPEEPTSRAEIPLALEVLRDQILREAPEPPFHPAERAIRRNLHVVHSWGGGLERWVQEYCRADRGRRNFILKSVGTWGAFGQELQLFAHIDDAAPLKRWPLSPPVRHTAGVHTGYRAALAEIIDSYGVDSILVSSLVGHSMDVYRTGLRTIGVCHDFYPFCPALNVTFESVCGACGNRELTRCTRDNQHHRFFRNVPPAQWEALRRSFVRAVTANGVRLAAPSPSVRDHYVKFLPELEPHFQVIPHGTRPVAADPLKLDFQSGKRLRVLVLGSLAPQKGSDLLAAMLDELLSLADLYLVGCGDYGWDFQRTGVTIMPEYEWSELPRLLRSISPHVGLLLSVVPETFSYTLQEMFELGIPPLATRLGSFADRIVEGETGFLADPTAEAVMARLRGLEANRGVLEAVHRRLCALPQRRTEEMLADYEAALGLPALSGRAYFARQLRPLDADHKRTVLQLMWHSEHDRFSEERSTTVYSVGSQESRVAVLRIPRQNAPLLELRLGFGTESGLLLLFRCRLRDMEEKTVWSWSSREGALQPKAACDVMFLGGGPGWLVYVSGPDPHLVLPLGAEALADLSDGGALEVEFGHPATEQALARMANAILEGSQSALSPEERQSVLRYLTVRMQEQTRQSGREAHAERLLQQLAEARDRVRDLEQSLSWRITSLLRWGGSILIPRIRRLRKPPAGVRAVE